MKHPFIKKRKKKIKEIDLQLTKYIYYPLSKITPLFPNLREAEKRAKEKKMWELAVAGKVKEFIWDI